MARYGMLIDASKCVGCFACRVACQMQNSLDVHESFIHYEEIESGSFPIVRNEHIPIACMHCEDAPCQAVCPTAATYTNADGVVLVDHSRCIGCKYCMTACPYQARVQNKATGVAEKCRFCVFTGGGGNNGSGSGSGSGSEPKPACVDTCITGARIFGDLDDPASDVAKAIIKTNAKPIAGDLTKVKVFYVR
ncbi:MAG: 4Fe-4S dicluster domain-containing protein [Coriobacteriales bacterium]|jgi:Fe-S-cluster-containing dehydrogenase component|nr:4Fe-4S dicluster domain-containing protein [Coriobacteriales bacterium]